MYAIIATGSKQYKVSEGDVIRVEKLDVEDGAAYEFTEVLAVNDGELTIGNPTVAGAVVKATAQKQGKGKKIIVYKYKRKSGYHKKNGHRQPYTEFKIDAIVK
ncbi:MAG: 50S ribosomal protein L21 [Lachnospiraceae bacterium]|nr:50S ribosomal protein L21 [Candidatus Minthocola equi]